MAKEEKPSYKKGRILDTKGAAQRIGLDFLRHPGVSRRLRHRLAWIAPLVALLAAFPYLFRGSEKFYENGKVSPSHAIFEKNCANCHAAKFSKVVDTSCQKCHDGPVHQANAIGIDKLRCAGCHIEHRGNVSLARVSDLQCTQCHDNLEAHGKNVKLRGTRITAFRENRHAEFSAIGKLDLRPLKLNHAKHMAATKEKNRLLAERLPMKCTACHVTDLESSKGNLLPVTFEKNCRVCHSRELEFDVYQLQGENAKAAPHTEDPQTIHNFILKTYQDLYDANPAVMQKPLDRDLEPVTNKQVWLDRVVKGSEGFLFERKCRQCHEYEGMREGYPVVLKVNPIRGRFVSDTTHEEKWLPHAIFSHRAHRAVTCESCHTEARNKALTTDVLIPKMSSCLPCHGSTGTAQDSCVQCHLYHDKSKENPDRDRRPVDELSMLLHAMPGRARP